jgi:hypothetical protein
MQTIFISVQQPIPGSVQPSLDGSLKPSKALLRHFQGVLVFLYQERLLISHRYMVLRKNSVNCYKRVIKEKAILVACQGEMVYT